MLVLRTLGAVKESLCLNSSLKGNEGIQTLLDSHVFVLSKLTIVHIKGICMSLLHKPNILYLSLKCFFLKNFLISD